MNHSDIIFWNVDTQIDFVEPKGKLYVEGAELLKPIWRKLTLLAKQKKFKVVNTADFHYPNSAELSKNPDFISTFPEHCMADTKGADYIWETQPEVSVVFDWDKHYFTLDNAGAFREIVIRKDAFDVFAGNKYTDEIVKLLAPKTVVVYGVTTNVCVDFAVVGLAERVEKVIIIEDAIKELPNISLPFDNWKKLGVQMMSFEELAQQF
ncbi:isochorismatase family cysteine hydrolase [uncultured Draconibacterium sp.]|uniref:isochorismatase family cysteine hydrolase n=1 Tax=uncultured Draconibacterium sp. TaxID=1573823 RepID=UPI0032603566